VSGLIVFLTLVAIFAFALFVYWLREPKPAHREDSSGAVAPCEYAEPHVHVIATGGDFVPYNGPGLHVCAVEPPEES
jgi:hypothetical protein